MHDVLEQLCNDYAYAVHQPHARNGGLIGLAAAAIALGSVSQGRFASRMEAHYKLLNSFRCVNKSSTQVAMRSAY